MTTKPKASDATHTDTQAAKAAENAGQAEHTATAPATAAPAGSGDAAAVVSTAPAASEAPPVHNPKRGGLYRQEGGDQPVAVHRTLHPDDPEAKKAMGQADLNRVLKGI